MNSPPMTGCIECGRSTLDWSALVFGRIGGGSWCDDCSHALGRAKKELIARHRDEYDLLLAMYRARRTPHGDSIR
jgi:hypothetical protein